MSIQATMTDNTPSWNRKARPLSSRGSPRKSEYLPPLDEPEQGSSATSTITHQNNGVAEYDSESSSPGQSQPLKRTKSLQWEDESVGNLASDNSDSQVVQAPSNNPNRIPKSALKQPLHHPTKASTKENTPAQPVASTKPPTKENGVNNYYSKSPDSNRPGSSPCRSPFSPVVNAEPGEPRYTTCDFIPSRSSSRQGKYHEDCNPKEDPSLVIGSLSRLLSAQQRRGRSARAQRPNSNVSNTSLLSHRESVVNLIYSGSEQDSGGNDRRYFLDRRASSVLSRMSAPVNETEVPHCDYPVIEEGDSPLSNRCLLSRSTNNSQYENPDYRPGFLYQVVSFDSLADNIPSFVRHNNMKNGRLVTESFILKVNYLRRRRQLGEISSTIGSSAKRAQQQIMAAASQSSGSGGGSPQATSD